jgi:hypothetical protein
MPIRGGGKYRKYGATPINESGSQIATATLAARRPMKCHWMRAALVIFEDPVCNGAFSKKIRSFWWILYPNEKLIAALQEDDWGLKASQKQFGRPYGISML